MDFWWSKQKLDSVFTYCSKWIDTPSLRYCSIGDQLSAYFLKANLHSNEMTTVNVEIEERSRLPLAFTLYSG